MPVRKRLSKAQGEIRHAVRQTLTKTTTPGQRLLVAVSGGADSMALAEASLFESKKLGLKLTAVIIDHSLQKASADVAAKTKTRLHEMGFEDVLIERVSVGKQGGPEAAARTARYQALESIREKKKAKFVLLGHTHNDQAETVLLGLVRGSGSKSIAGMSEVSGSYLRPLLGIERATTIQFCKDAGIKFWSDPQNQDSKFLRVVIRLKVLPFLEKTLGGSVAKALVRTADQLRADNSYLESQSLKAFKKLAKVSGKSLSFDVMAMSKLPEAILHRVIKTALDGFGEESSRVHVLEVGDLVLAWHGQKPLSLPGVRVVRSGKTLSFESTRSKQWTLKQ